MKPFIELLVAMRHLIFIHGSILALALSASAIAEEPAPKPITNSIGMTLVHVPAGEVVIGSPADEAGRDDDEHRRTVRIASPIYVAAHEVTQQQFERVMGRNPSAFCKSGTLRERVADQSTAEHPVDSVAWADAVAFCEKLNALPDEKAAGRTYRLPTEAEWEHACRAGSAGPWSFGNDVKHLAAHAWFGRKDAEHRTQPVGRKQPNLWGLYDMHGNVWEWCADAHAADNAADPHDDTRVIRGGSWYSPAASTRCAERRGDPPTVREPDTGFRVVLEIRK